MVLSMIKTFADKELQRLFNRDRSKCPEQLQKRVRNKLELMDSCGSLDDLAAILGGNLEPLKGKRKGQHSLQVRGNWRLCFVWENGHIFDVELVDYH
jgi:toxin HigB-1